MCDGLHSYCTWSFPGNFFTLYLSPHLEHVRFPLHTAATCPYSYRTGVVVESTTLLHISQLFSHLPFLKALLHYLDTVFICLNLQVGSQWSLCITLLSPILVFAILCLLITILLSHSLISRTCSSRRWLSQSFVAPIPTFLGTCCRHQVYEFEHQIYCFCSVFS